MKKARSKNMTNQEKTEKHKNMKNRDLYETPCLWAEIEVFTNRAQEKLKKTRKNKGATSRYFGGPGPTLGYQKTQKK